MYYLKRKKDKIMKYKTDVENKTQIMQHVSKMQYASLLLEALNELLWFIFLHVSICEHRLYESYGSQISKSGSLCLVPFHLSLVSDKKKGYAAFQKMWYLCL